MDGMVAYCNYLHGYHRKEKIMIQYNEKTRIYIDDNGIEYYDIKTAAKKIKRSEVTLRRYIRLGEISKILDDRDRHRPDYCKRILVPCKEIDNW